MTIAVGPPGPAARGRLGLFVEGAIERALEGRNAPPPGVRISSNLQESFDDQLLRAQFVGASGLRLRFGSMRGITSSDSAFDTEDSAVVRWLLLAARRRPLRLFFHPDDRNLGVFREPVTLESLLDEAGLSSFPPPAPAPEVVASARAMELAKAIAPASEVPESSIAYMDGVREERAALDDSARLTEELLAALERSAAEHESELRESARALADEVSETDWLRETLIHLSTPPPAQIATAPSGAVEMADICELSIEQPRWELTPASVEDFIAAAFEEEDAIHEAYAEDTEVTADGASPEADEELVVDAAGDAESAKMELQGEDAPEPSETAEPAEATEPSESAELEVAKAFEPELAPAPTAQPEIRSKPPRPRVVDPDLVASARMWERELSASQGPKPLSVVERQFTAAYMPLRGAVARGAASESAPEVLGAWAASFEKSYTEAFEVLRYRGKRPMMVLDLPDIAGRVARLHGARTTQLVLVDGLRFDVGMMVDERLRSLVGGRAACAERLLLWSALPTTTATQVELIGRGPMGLRELMGIGDEDMLVAKGRKAATMRRLKTGRRELLKLDIVESRLSEPGAAEPERLAEIADEVSERLAAHFEGVPERTLVVVFGDHGFLLDPREGGTTAARHGGASPEEVLVPAFAWICGSLH